MPDLPQGTVTFMFTDIEGSTKLWEQYPQAMGAALMRHDMILASEIQQHEGVVIKNQGEGDSFFAVFPRVADALNSAINAQLAFKSERWPDGISIRIRVSLHTGEAFLRDNDYFGRPVNRCARIRSIAHGSQIVLSQTTASLAQDSLPDDTSLRDLGTYRLRDLETPERVFQLVHPELPSEFPPLKTTVFENPSSGLNESDWDDLLTFVRDGVCTPIIGPGINLGHLPLRSEIAMQWAEEHEYPLPDSYDLPRVALYMAVERFPMYPKTRMRRIFQDLKPPDFSSIWEPYSVLADMNLPLYINTNFDGFMADALRSRRKTPSKVFCRWDESLRVLDEGNGLNPHYVPSALNPLVYHLHGIYELPQTMVLTETDHLNLLIRLTSEQDFLPAIVRQQLAMTSLMFVGFGLDDWVFRVLFRGLISSVRAGLSLPGICVQLPLTGLTDRQVEHARRFVDKFVGEMQHITKVRVYWGDVRSFAREFRERWGST